MINKEKLLHALKNPRSAIRKFRLHHFARRYPKIYFTTVLLTALAGFGYLLLFPALVIIALIQLTYMVQSAPFTMSGFSAELLWFALFIFASAICHYIFTVKFEPPKGTVLPDTTAPALFALVEDRKGRLFWPRLHSIVLGLQCELEIYKIPVTGIPLWSRNTLVIGFPLMQTLAQHYFDCALVRKMVQHAKGRNIVTNWLYQLRYTWSLYPKAFSRRKLLGEQLIMWFFQWYAPFYQKLSQYTAQQEELAADTLALQEINDFDLLKTFENQTIAEYFFYKIYMPKVAAFLREANANPTKLSPYTTLPKVFRKTVNEERGRQWLELLNQSTLNTQSAIPTLSQRMSNIGHSRMRLPKLGEASAAEHYFSAHYAQTAQLMDNIWRQKASRRLKRRPRATPRRNHGTEAPASS